MRRIGYVRGGFSFLPAPGPVAMRRAFCFGGRGEEKAEPVKANDGAWNPGEETAEPVKGLIRRLLTSVGCSAGQVPVLRCSFSQYRVPGSGFHRLAFPDSVFRVPGSAVSSPRLPATGYWLRSQVFGAFAESFEELGLVDDLDAERASLVGLGAWVRSD